MRPFLIPLIILIVSICILISTYFVSPSERFSELETIGVYKMDKTLNFKLPSDTLPNIIIDNPSLNHFLKFEKQDNYADADMLMFSSLNDIEDDLKKLTLSPKLKYLNAFFGIDAFAGKNNFADVMKKSSVLPKTFIVSSIGDMIRFDQDSTGLYIIKKNIQQQKGIVISNDKKEIKRLLSEDPQYVVIQELLQDPFLVANRKINIRIYMLVILNKNATPSFYFFNDGFMYYAGADWQPLSIDPAVNITTGLGDRHIYESNPLTFKDLKQKFPDVPFDDKIREALVDVKKCYSSLIQKKNSKKLERLRCFQIFGVDIAPSSGCKQIQIMEINKGPDLTYKDERDKTVKQEMMAGVLSIVCGNDSDNNGFISI